MQVMDVFDDSRTVVGLTACYDRKNEEFQDKTDDANHQSAD